MKAKKSRSKNSYKRRIKELLENLRQLENTNDKLIRYKSRFLDITKVANQEKCDGVSSKYIISRALELLN